MLRTRRPRETCELSVRTSNISQPWRNPATRNSEDGTCHSNERAPKPPEWCQYSMMINKGKAISPGIEMSIESVLCSIYYKRVVTYIDHLRYSYFLCE